jgi:hypothetical protein
MTTNSGAEFVLEMTVILKQDLKETMRMRKADCELHFLYEDWGVDLPFVPGSEHVVPCPS